MIENARSKGIFDFHADDYAISVASSEIILELLKKGLLDSISVIPNMSCFEECMQLFANAEGDISVYPKVSVHINLMEGKACLDRTKIPGLVDKQNYFKLSWGSLLLNNYNPFTRKKVKEQLTLEMIAQIEKILVVMPKDYVLRIDSHQHTHMIPIVFEALVCAVDKIDRKVEFIRVPKEPIIPFLKVKKLWHTFSFVNLIKNVILNYYGRTAMRLVKVRSLEEKALWGVIMTGYMDADRCQKLYAPMLAYAKNKGIRMEVLFHPGSVDENEITEEYGKRGFISFHRSNGRQVEYNAIHKLNEIK